MNEMTVNIRRCIITIEKIRLHLILMETNDTIAVLCCKEI